MRWGIRLIGLSVALLVAGAVAIVVAIPRFTDGQALSVLSGSMSPTIPVGSIVLVRPTDPAQLSVGDIATYQPEPGKSVYITHRIAAIDDVNGQTQFTFKGDANRGADIQPVGSGQIRGKVWFHVPWLGQIRDDLKSGGLILLALVLVGGYAVVQGVSGVRESRKEARGVPA